jgi:hypothetical protein
MTQNKAYGTSFVMRLDEEIDYDLHYIRKELRKRLNYSKAYPKSVAVQDVIKAALKNKEEIINKIMEDKQKKGDNA